MDTSPCRAADNIPNASFPFYYSTPTLSQTADATVNTFQISSVACPGDTLIYDACFFGSGDGFMRYDISMMRTPSLNLYYFMP